MFFPWTEKAALCVKYGRGIPSESNHNHRALLWLFGVWGGAFQQAFVQFGPDCIACCSNPFLPVSSSCGSSFASSKLFCSFSSLLLSSGLFHCCLWQETLFGSLPVLSALPSEEEDLRGLDRLGNVPLIVKVRFAGNASEW